MRALICYILMLFLSSGTLSVVNAQSDTLVIGIHVNPPFVTQKTNGGYEGLSIELWENIATQSNLNYRYVVYSDPVGILKSLEYKDIDLTINPMDVNEKRARKFDVTQPYFISSIGVAVPSVNRNPISLYISNIFSWAFLEIIFLLLIVIFIFGFLLWLAERKANRFQFRPGVLGLLDGLWWSAVTMTTVGYGDKAPKTNVGKALAIIWMFTAVIIISSFTAGIASTLTVSSLQTEIRNSEDIRLVDNISTVGASNSEEYLRKEKIGFDKLYQSPIVALRALAKKENDALIYDHTILQYYINRLSMTDEVRLLPLTIQANYQSFMCPKDHPNFDVINVGLIQEIQNDTWKDLLKKYNVN